MERIKNGVRKNLVLTYVDLPVNRQYLQRLGNSIIADLLGFSRHIKPGFNNQCLSIKAMTIIKYLTEVTTTRERSLIRHEDETILEDKEGNEPIYA